MAMEQTLNDGVYYVQKEGSMYSDNREVCGDRIRM